MRSLEENNWDIQFFPDGPAGEKGLDTSFYWARPCNNTINFFQKVKSLWSEEGDQNLKALMNVVGWEMADGDGRLRLKQFTPTPFVGWEDYLDWESDNFSNETALNILYNKTAAIHMTCVEPNLMTFMARSLGAWGNLEQYYTGDRKFLGIKGLEGDFDHITKVIGFAAKVALDTHRSFIFPSSTTITQARKNAAGGSDYVKVEDFPAYRVVDPSSLDHLTMHTTESMFLNNRARFTDKALTSDTIIMGNGHSAKDPSNGKPIVVKTIIDKPNIEVVWLDMGNGRWWDLDASGAMVEYTKDVLTSLRTCGNVNEEKFECSKRCV